MAKNNTSVETILSTLNPEAAAALRDHFRQEVASEIASGLVASAKPAKRSAGASKAHVGGAARQRTNDGTNRSASQFIRDFDAANPDANAKDVCAKASEVGLTIEPSLVYNVRQLVRNKAAEGEVDKEETQAKRVAALEKARAAKAANKEAAKTAANEKTAKKGSKAKAEA
jgi:hypothetical protein